ncbi:MAG: 2-C-methyl-D-erythritol 4-phosphate cytidylyltransferase [Burkholderiaceae bacterium]
MTQPDSSEFVAIVPAGGTGARVGGAIPKQYQPLAGQAMLVHTVRNLLRANWIRRILIVVAANEADRCAALGLPTDRTTVLGLGGATRRDSVLAGLRALRHDAAATGDAGLNPWVMVHDAARPGIPLAVLERLKTAVSGGADQAGAAVGALAAVPVSDTVKEAAQQAQGDSGAQVARTISRERLWLAQTPQVFRLEPLVAALEAFPGATDEAVAMEHAGHTPALVPGHWKNLKVTTPDDIELAESILRNDLEPRIFHQEDR